MRIAVVHADSANTTPPTGYGGISRLAWAFAREAAAAGARVRLFAPRLVPDIAAYTGMEAIAGFPAPGELDDVDAVYFVDCVAVGASVQALSTFRLGPIIVEENAPNPWRPINGQCFHVAYRADRLNSFPRGRAWLCDQIIDREEVGPPGSPRGYVLWMGRAHAEKGVESLITFARSLPHVPLLLAGPEQTGRHHWPANVHLVGEISGAKKRELLTGADALVYTVNPMWTGAGEGVLTEAVACGIPVLAQSYSRGTPATRLIVDGCNGFVHPDAGVLARLYPLALEMDRSFMHRNAWARLAPDVVAQDRIERIRGARTMLGLSNR